MGNICLQKNITKVVKIKSKGNLINNKKNLNKKNIIKKLTINEKKFLKKITKDNLSIIISNDTFYCYVPRGEDLFWIIAKYNIKKLAKSFKNRKIESPDCTFIKLKNKMEEKLQIEILNIVSMLK